VGWGTLKKVVRDFGKSSSFFFAGEDVFFNKVMVALDFLLRFLSRKKEGFCFFQQKERQTARSESKT
jgi:hypothetical protein